MKFLKLIVRSTIFVSVFQANSALALDLVVAQSAIDSGVELLETQQNISEGGWGNAIGVDYVYTSSAVEALRSANQNTGAYYGGVAWLENHHANNNDLKARKIMALVSRGNNIAPDLALIGDAKREVNQVGWGLSGGYYNSPLETALVLQALHTASVSVNPNAISYLVASQMADGAWSAGQGDVSSYWISAEVALALINFKQFSGVSSALAQVTEHLTNMDASAVSSLTLARVSLALHKIGGQVAVVDSQLSSLLNKQVSEGDWGDILATSNAITALAYGVGINPAINAERILFDDEQLRIAINTQLGREAYGNITQADLDALTTLDLRSFTITSLNGLQRVSYLTVLQVNSATDTSSMEDIAGLTLVVDSDSDNIAESADNCPNHSNASQTDIDGDGNGDECDDDMDGDGMPNSWEDRYAFNIRNSADAITDADTDLLSNLKEFQIGTDPLDPDSDGDTVIDGDEVAYDFDPLDHMNPVDANDYDNDGLSNADEAVWGSDPMDVDTDKDSLSDGDEVAVGRSPVLNEPVLIVIITSLLL
jgi:hypothetical protein